MTLRVLIVDDEAPARALLRELLAEQAEVEVAGEAANGFEAVKQVAETRPDVVLLDVQMPKLDGFEVLELLGADRPAVVFVTAYEEHALRAFEVHAVDYLLKPVAPERLAEALARVERAGAAAATPPLDAVELRQEARPGPLDRILIRDGDEIHVVAVDRLDYLEAQDDVVVLVAGKERFRKAETLGRLEEQLDPRRFVRIHRSYLLHVERLGRLELYAKDSRVAVLRDGTRLPVSRAGYARLRELL